MLVIRKPQMAALQQVAERSFEDRMVAHLTATYPARYADLGEAGTRDFIRRGIDYGKRHGVTARGAVQVLLELTSELGERFALSPDPEWAAQILAHPTLPDYLKMDLIRDRFGDLTGGRVLIPFDPSAP